MDKLNSYDRALVYCRVSTTKRTQEESLESQEAAGRKAAVELGYNNPIVLSEQKSATTAEKRENYRELLRLVEQRAVDIIIVKDNSRLNRNSTNWCQLRDLIKITGVKVYHYLTRRYADFGFADGVMALKDSEYSEELSVKINRAHEDRQRAGSGVILNNRVWGYKVRYNPDGTTYIAVDEREAEMIRVIFDLYVNSSLGGHRLANRLYEMGYRNRNGRRFSEAVLRDILTNPKVIGTAVMKKTEFNFYTKETKRLTRDNWVYHEGLLPSIIDTETFEKAQEIRTSRAAVMENGHMGGIYRGKYALSGKIICGYCGDRYGRDVRKIKSGNIHEWSCNTYTAFGRKTPNKYRSKAEVYNSAGCDNVRLKEEMLMDIIEKVKSEYFTGGDSVIKEALALLKEAFINTGSYTDIKAEKEAKQHKLEAIEKKAELLLDNLLDGTITKDRYKAKNATLEEEKSRINKELLSLENCSMDASDLDSRIENIKNTLSDDTMANIELDAFLKYIDVIKVYTDRLDIHINLETLTGLQLYLIAEDAKQLVITEQLSLTSYTETAMERTKNQVYKLIQEDNKIHIGEIVEKTGLSKSLVNARIKTLKAEGKITSQGTRDTFQWVLLQK